MTQPPSYQPPYQAPGPYQQQPYQQQPGQGPYQAPGGYPQPPDQPYQQPQYQQPYQPQYGQPQYGQQEHQQYQGAPQAYPQQYQAPQQQAGYQTQGQGQGVCRICGSGPAAQATFRAVVGAVFMHTIWTAPGPYCRDCGLHTFRRQTAKTLGGGWCSIGAIVMTPIFLLMNVSARGKIANLPAPQPRGDGRAPLDPGRPVFQRPVAYVYPVLGATLLLLIIVGNLSG